MTYKKIIGISSIVTTSLYWISSQINKTRDILDNLVDTSIYDVMEHQDTELREEDNVLVSWIHNYDETESVLNTVWQRIKFLYARRLLNMSSSDSALIRSRAVSHLAHIKSLENWQYSLLRHMCDATVAVSLAREPNVDLRFFSPVPQRLNYNNQTLVHATKEYLLNLSERANHICIKNFVSQAFADEHEIGYFYDSDPNINNITKILKSSPEILPVCLQSILHHSTIDRYSSDIVLCNGLNLLMEIYNHSKDNMENNIMISNILANISNNKNLLADLHKLGWIGVLSKWANDSNIRLAVPAAKTLANLDRDHSFQCTYLKNVYLLHPTLRGSHDQAEVDVVFVHGLLGGVMYTWRQRDKVPIGLIGKGESERDKQESLTAEAGFKSKLLHSSDPNVREYMQEMKDAKEEEYENIGHGFEYVMYDLPENSNGEMSKEFACDRAEYCEQTAKSRQCPGPTQCWPRDWLPLDCDQVRVIGINYSTTVSMWTGMCDEQVEGSRLETRSAAILEQLIAAGVGRRPVVFVCHSMGGLLVKDMLVKSAASDKEEKQQFVQNTKGIVFYSTPHKGSSFASFKPHTSLIVMPSVEVQELREESEKLRLLHEQFVQLLQIQPIDLISFVETRSTVISAMKITISLVQADSAKIGIGEYYEIPQDHLGICKPFNRQSFLYQRVVRLINDVVNDCVVNKGETMPSFADF